MTLLEENTAKSLLEPYGLSIPRGDLVNSAQDAGIVGARLGFPVMLKAQVPVGGRGRSGGVLRVDTEREACDSASEMLDSVLAGYAIKHLRVEKCLPHDNEYFLAVLDDPLLRTAQILCCASGGIEIEELEEQRPGSIHRMRSSIGNPLNEADVAGFVRQSGVPECDVHGVGIAIQALWNCYEELDAEVVEVNPLAVDESGVPWALDIKLILDDAARLRHPELPYGTNRETGSSELEAAAQAMGLFALELDGNVGIVANGAGLTMATLDAVSYFGGAPGNVVEIGGDNYTKGRLATEFVLSNSRLRSLLVNFCGAFARTDVMAKGVVDALQEYPAHVPVVFSIHGTGEVEAIELVQRSLGICPYDIMDDAVRAAVAVAREELK